MDNNTDSKYLYIIKEMTRIEYPELHAMITNHVSDNDNNLHSYMDAWEVCAAEYDRQNPGFLNSLKARMELSLAQCNTAERMDVDESS